MKRSAHNRLLLVLALLASAACGGDDKANDDNDDAQQPGLTVSASPATVSIRQGTTATVTIALARVALSGAVTLTVAGAPAGVTATIDPSSTTADTATLTVTSSEAATLGAATLTVTATGESVSATASIGLTVTLPDPVNLAGTVVNGFGVPRAGVLIHVWGNGATSPVDATSASDGTFSVQGIRPPYDAVVIGTTTRVFIGMTSATPMLAELTDQSYGPGTVPVTGDFTGTTAGARTIVSVDTATSGAYVETDDNATTYAANLVAPAIGSVNATMKVLHFTVTGGVPSAYHSYVTRAASLDLPTPDDEDFYLSGGSASVASRNLTIRARTSTGGNVGAVGVVWAGDRRNIILGQAVPTTDTTVLLAPNDARIPLAVQALAASGKSSSSIIEPVGAGATFDLVAPPGLTQVTPIDGAINVTDAQSIASDIVADATYYFILTGAGTPLIVVSSRNTVELARLRELGAGLSSGTVYTLSVFAVFGGGPDPFAPSRLQSYHLARTSGAGFRTVQNYSFATQ